MPDEARVDPTEAELRDADVPYLGTQEELVAYIASLLNQKHEYGTMVYAMSLAAVAALRYVACTLGATGVQVSGADLDILRRTRHIEGPFMLAMAEHMLYPQSKDPGESLRESQEEWREWLAEAAGKRLAALSDGVGACPEVIAHWKKLAAYVKPTEKRA